jgi:hypothetical protein
MAKKKKSSIPKFMKYAGSISGPPDLSSRRGFSRVALDEVADERAEVKSPKKSRPEEARRAKQ